MVQEIIDFWFSEEVRKLLFDSTPEFDALLRERFRGASAIGERGEVRPQRLDQIVRILDESGEVEQDDRDGFDSC